MLGNFHNKLSAILQRNLDCFVDFRQSVTGKLHIQNGTDNLSDFS